MTGLFDPQTTPDPDVAVLAAELSAALEGREGWVRLDGDTFVSASLPGGAGVHGNSGGWWLIESGPTGAPVATTQESAAAAVGAAVSPS